MKITISVHCDSTFEASLAIEALKNMRTVELDTYLAGKTIDNKFAAPPRSPAPVEEEKPEPKERDNVSPGWVSASRIGSDTKKAILEYFPGRSNDDASMDIACKRFKRDPNALMGLLQLLWERGEIKHDEKGWYV